MEFNIQGKVILNIDWDIEANSEEDAIAKIKEKIIDMYNLNLVNTYHNKEETEFKLDAMELD